MGFGKEKCFLCKVPIKDKLYVQEIPGVEVVRNKFVCSLHLDLCTACWGSHQSVFGQGNSSDKLHKDNFWATKRYKRGIPAAAPYFYFPEQDDVLRRELTPFFECCHPYCFCMRCNKPRIICRFIPSNEAHLYCKCGKQPGPPAPAWETYGSLGSATHEQGPFTLAYIFFPYLKNALFGRHLLKNYRPTSDDNARIKFKELETKILNGKDRAARMFIGFALNECSYFLGIQNITHDAMSGDRALLEEEEDSISDYLSTLFQYVYLCFQPTFTVKFDKLIKEIEGLENRNGKSLFELIDKNVKGFRVVYIALVLNHLMVNQPWGELTDDFLSSLTLEMFEEWKSTVQKEAAGYMDGRSEQRSFMLRTTPQIILQGDLGLNIFGRSLKFSRQNLHEKMTLEKGIDVLKNLMVSKYDCNPESIEDISESKVNDVYSQVKTKYSSYVENENINSIDSRNLALSKNEGKQRFTSLSTVINALNSTLESEECNQETAALVVLSSAFNMIKDDDDCVKDVGSDVLRASLSDQTNIFQKGFSENLCAIASNAEHRDLLDLSPDDQTKLQRGIYASGVSSCLAVFASPHFAGKYKNFTRSLKEAKNNPSSIPQLEKDLQLLVKQTGTDADKMFISPEGKVGLFLILGSKIKSDRELEECDVPLIEWFTCSSQSPNSDIDAKVYDIIHDELAKDRSKTWNIATPTFESYVDCVLEKPLFACEQESQCTLPELLAIADSKFNEALSNLPAHVLDDVVVDDDKQQRLQKEIVKRNEITKLLEPYPISPALSSSLGNALLDTAINDKEPKAPLINALTVVDPESVCNNPGLLKVSAEQDLGIKSAGASESKFEQLKKQLEEKPTVRSRDVITDMCNNNKPFFDFENATNNDKEIEEYIEANSVYDLLTNKPECFQRLDPVDKLAFANNYIMKNSKIDPAAKEELCKKVLDSIENEELCKRLYSGNAHLNELLEMGDESANAPVTLLSEEEKLFQNAANTTVDPSLFESEKEILPKVLDHLKHIEDNFENMRELAKSTVGDAYSPEVLGLTQADEDQVKRRYINACLESLPHNIDRDSVVCKALNRVANKYSRKPAPVVPPKCSRCSRVFLPEDFSLELESNSLVSRCRSVKDQKCDCVGGCSNTSRLCVVYQSKLTEDVSCANLHAKSYYETLFARMNKQLNEYAEGGSVPNFLPEKYASYFLLWLKVKEKQPSCDQLDSEQLLFYQSVQSWYCAHQTFLLRREDSSSALIDNFREMTSFAECIAKVKPSSNESCPCYEFLLRGQALETFEIFLTVSFDVVGGMVLRDDILLTCQMS